MLLVPVCTRARRALPDSIPVHLQQARTHASRALPVSGRMSLAPPQSPHARRALPARGPVLLVPAGTRARRALPASIPAQRDQARTHASRALQIITRPLRVLLHVSCAGQEAEPVIRAILPAIRYAPFAKRGTTRQHQTAGRATHVWLAHINSTPASRLARRAMRAGTRLYPPLFCLRSARLACRASTLPRPKLSAPTACLENTGRRPQ